MAKPGPTTVLDGGRCIGTFCVIDTRPRELSPADRTTLRDLRDLAMEQIQRTRVEGDRAR